MIKNKWALTRWNAPGVKDGPTESITIDCRPAPEKTNWNEFKPLIRMRCTDRYTEAEYLEIARVVVDRLNAWEVEKELQ